MPLGSGWSAGEQRLAGGGERRQVRHRRGKALRAGDQLEIGKLDLERHRPARNLGPLDPRPGVAGDPLELGGQRVGIAQILVEGALGADRFVRPVGLDLALVDAAADPPVPAARAAEMRLELRQAPGPQVGAGEDPEPLHLARGDRPDAVEARHRQRRDELGAALGRDDAQPVGLAWSEASLAMNLQ